MPNFNQFTLLNHQWNDFIHRLEILNHLSSQYERISLHYIDTSVSDLKQKQYDKNQLELLTNENNIDEQRLDVFSQEMNDIQSFLNSIHQWKKRILENL